MSLEAKLSNGDHDTAFLLPAEFHPLAKELKLKVVDVDHKAHDGLRTEMVAYQKFKPDVVVDDASVYTFFVKQVAKKPRAAVQRTGMFPGAIPKSKTHVHSMGRNVNMKEFEMVRNFGLHVPQHFEDLFAAEMKIVPGIGEIEVLPEPLKSDPSYVFSGPLLLEDSQLEKVNKYYQEKTGKLVLYSSDLLNTFFNNNQKRFIVYFTFGNVARAENPIFAAIQYLLDNEVAVITNINIGEVPEQQKELYLYSSFLPMHYICSRVNLMIHHCGSGTYQYQILYQLPAITLGTGCWDREDVALRLQELEVSIHLPPPGQCEDFDLLFKGAFDSFFGSSPNLYENARKKLSDLKEESRRVMAAFNFREVLEQAVEKEKHGD
jgi:UDP:flavonoid glycosyltransferase YjiC (YdhE family)